jgi:predicted nucleotide-binding protein
MSEFPKHSLERALRIAEFIENENGGKPMPPTDIAIGLGVSPGSSDFRILLSSSYKYGLTLGSYKQEKIELTGLATSVMLPVDDQSRQLALRSAALTPTTFRGLFEHFKGKKLPEGAFLENTIARDFGVPKTHAAKCAQIFRENLERVNLLRKATTGLWVSSEVETPRSRAVDSHDEEGVDHRTLPPGEGDVEDAEFTTVTSVPPRSGAVSPAVSNKVFVTHGRNRELVPQLKELLTFGQFEPVVSVERESVSKPVPDKVLDDMRSCGAAIIHVDAEQEVMTQAGDRMVILNQNVLIEIGAAMALYGRRFILLVKNGAKLPSNLQGLYEVRYEGEKLDGDATLRLLKAFNEFKSETSKTARQ